MESSVKDIYQQLRAPLPSKSISWRVGRKTNNDTVGQALPFITPRVIQNMLDDIVGPSNWRNSFQGATLGAGNASVIAIIELRLDGEWIAKSDAAQVDSFKDDSENNSREMAIKGAYSDAFKRAAVMWGMGRYLYEYDAPWIPLDGKRLSETPILPLHMLPEAEHAEAIAAQAARDEAAEVADKAADKTANKVAEKPAEKAAVKVAEVAAETKAPAKAEVKREAPAEVPAAKEVKAETRPAPVADEVKPTPLAEAPSDEVQAQERAAALVDQELGSEVAGVKPVAAPANSDSAAATAAGIPEGLNAEQQKTFDGLIEKIKKKLPTQMLRNYVNGPKAASSLPESARAHLLVLLDQAEAAKDAA